HIFVATASQDRYVRIWKLSEILAAATPSTSAAGGVPSSIPDTADQRNQVAESVDDADREDEGGVDLTADVDLNDLMLESLAEAEMADSGIQLSTKAHVFDAPSLSGGKNRYSVVLDSVLISHDDWVHSVEWHPPVFSDDSAHPTQPLVLLSSSADKTIILWAPSVQASASSDIQSNSSIWLPMTRLGTAAGESGVGFYSAKFARGGNRVVATGHRGGMFVWDKSAD
ncbi:Elongator subunit elp2, partial [Gonapodya sp. JEL0774]